MEIRLIAVGRLRTPGTAELYAEYAGRIGRCCRFSCIELPEAAGAFKNPRELIERESRLILEKIANHPYALCTPEGTLHDSPGFAAWLGGVLEREGRCDIVIGGSEGVSPDVMEKAAWRLSLSRLTFPHQLFRGLLAEQLYRALMILKGHPYHK